MALFQPSRGRASGTESTQTVYSAKQTVRGNGRRPASQPYPEVTVPRSTAPHPPSGRAARTRRTTSATEPANCGPRACPTTRSSPSWASQRARSRSGYATSPARRGSGMYTTSDAPRGFASTTRPGQPGTSQRSRPRPPGSASSQTGKRSSPAPLPTGVRARRTSRTVRSTGWCSLIATRG